MLRYLLIGMAKASWFYCVCIIQMLINCDKLYVNLHCFSIEARCGFKYAILTRIGNCLIYKRL